MGETPLHIEPPAPIPETMHEIDRSGEPVFEPGASAMDPFNSNHLALATDVVYESTKGPNTNGGTPSDTGDWKQVFSNGANKDDANKTLEMLKPYIK